MTDNVEQRLHELGIELPPAPQPLGAYRAAAELSALNVLAQLRRHLGGFERLRCIVRLEGHVASAPGFHEQPKVLDAASELLTKVLGDRAGHARTAFGPSQLPANAAIELIAIADIG